MGVSDFEVSGKGALIPDAKYHGGMCPVSSCGFRLIPRVRSIQHVPNSLEIIKLGFFCMLVFCMLVGSFSSR